MIPQIQGLRLDHPVYWYVYQLDCCSSLTYLAAVSDPIDDIDVVLDVVVTPGVVFVPTLDVPTLTLVDVPDILTIGYYNPHVKGKRIIL